MFWGNSPTKVREEQWKKGKEINSFFLISLGLVYFWISDFIWLFGLLDFWFHSALWTVGLANWQLEEGWPADSQLTAVSSAAARPLPAFLKHSDATKVPSCTSLASRLTDNKHQQTNRQTNKCSWINTKVPSQMLKDSCTSPDPKQAQKFSCIKVSSAKMHAHKSFLCSQIAVIGSQCQCQEHKIGGH